LYVLANGCEIGRSVEASYIRTVELNTLKNKINKKSMKNDR